MPIKRPPLVNNEIYHLVIRGVGDERIFKDINDYYRGIFSLFEFNNRNPVEISDRRRKRKLQKSKGEQFSDTRDRLVDILQFCFMPNHIHLLVRQIADMGITNFMRKLGAGYAAYFNKKYQRKGHLFQGRFYAVHIKNGEQLQTVFVYIHANPVSLIEPNWKENGIRDSRKAIRFLKDYKWSSHQDYIGHNNFPSVTERSLLLGIFGGNEGCGSYMNDWIEYKRKLNHWDVVGIE